VSVSKLSGYVIELSEMECFSDNIDGAADAVMAAQAMIRDEMTFFIVRGSD